MIPIDHRVSTREVGQVGAHTSVETGSEHLRPGLSGSDRSTHSRIGYRPDIDGLRAVAVLAVVGFHASSAFVPGGFVGVDIFFVISGFLISGILFTQFAQGRFNLADFYARRVRRIFPALVVVLAGCWAFGWFALLSGEYRELEAHIASGAVFLSNITLWSESGRYFNAPSQFKPLLHLWSLGIEEQFYLFWPTLLYICWRRGINVVSVMAAIVLASFSLNVGLIARSTDATFYLPHSRIWELILGGLVAYVECFKRDEFASVVNRVIFRSPDRYDDGLVANIKAWAGLLLVGFAAMELDKDTLYPGWWALLPTLGAALLISAGARSWVNRRLLGNRLAIAIGLISYPLYLWHWPLLSFVRITENGVPSRTTKAVATAVAFLLAWLTYVAIERPIRRGVSPRTRFRLAAVTASLLLIGAVSFYANMTRAFTSRVPQFVTDVPVYPEPRDIEACRQKFPTPAEDCQVYSSGVPVTTALIGDSHAEHVLRAVGSSLEKKGEGVVLLEQSGCPPLIDVERYQMGTTDTCLTVNNTVIDYLSHNDDIRRIVMSFRGVADVTGRGFGDIESSYQIIFRVAGTNFSNAESMRVALERTVDHFLGRKKEVWLLLQVPELGFVIGECVGRPVSFERRVRTPCGVPRSVVTDRQRPYRQIVEQVQAKLPALKIFDPIPYMCDERTCFAISDNTLLYRDDDHLSREGSLLLGEKLRF